MNRRQFNKSVLAAGALACSPLAIASGSPVETKAKVFPTGISDIDEAIGGIRPGQVMAVFHGCSGYYSPETAAESKLAFDLLAKMSSIRQTKTNFCFFCEFAPCEIFGATCDDICCPPSISLPLNNSDIIFLASTRETFSGEDIKIIKTWAEKNQVAVVFNQLRSFKYDTNSIDIIVNLACFYSQPVATIERLTSASHLLREPILMQSIHKPFLKSKCLK